MSQDPFELKKGILKTEKLRKFFKIAHLAGAVEYMIASLQRGKTPSSKQLFWIWH